MGRGVWKDWARNGFFSRIFRENGPYQYRFRPKSHIKVH